MPGTYPANVSTPPLALAPEDATRVRTMGDRVVLFCNDDDSNALTMRTIAGTDTAYRGFVSGVQDNGKGEFRWTNDNGADLPTYLLRVYPNEAAAPPFIIGTLPYTNVSGTRKNQVWSMGWNMGAGGGGPFVGGEPAIGMGFESCWSPDGTTNDYMEYHIYFVTAAAVQRRPWSFVGNRTTGTMSSGMNGESIIFCKEAGGVQTLIIDNTVSPVTCTFGRWEQLDVVLRNENNDIPFLEQVNAQQNAWLEVIRLNASNEVELGHGAVPTKCAGTFACNNKTPAAAPDYTITNPSTSRSLDVGAATLAELRAVVGTLLQDLINVGIAQ